MKNNCVRIFLLAFAILFFLDVSKGWTAPVVLDFNTYPGGNWQLISSGGISYVSGGMLTIDAPADYHEFILWSPYDEWHEYVDNSRGWVIEAKLKIDSTTAPRCGGGRGAVQIWANDYDILLIIGFSTDEICIAYPDLVKHAMDTTNDFHVYRIEAQFNHVKIYVDDNLRIEHTLTWPGGGSQILTFGDGVGGSKSLSYWDYFWYDVFPQIEVTIDIKPGSYPNSINLKSKGKVPVAILTTDDFDAYDVDPDTCVFANANPLRWNMEDVDNDGDHDMLFHFKTQELDLTKDSTEATLEGETYDGVQITGTDSVNIVPKQRVW